MTPPLMRGVEIMDSRAPSAVFAFTISGSWSLSGLQSAIGRWERCSSTSLVPRACYFGPCSGRCLVGQKFLMAVASPRGAFASTWPPPYSAACACPGGASHHHDRRTRRLDTTNATCLRSLDTAAWQESDGACRPAAWSATTFTASAGTDQFVFSEEYLDA